MKKTVFLFLLLAACCGVGKGIHWMRKGFTLRRIAAPTHMKMEIWDAKADRAIDQPFRYLGRGRQCFAFESLDGQYVLKFPRTDIYQIPYWARIFPFLPKTSLDARSQREHFVLNSMKIAYEELQEETGTLGIHFGQSEDRGKKLTLIDPLGISYSIPASKSSFILQLKRPILMKAFLDALQAGEKERGKIILDAFINLVVSRGMKGIWNKDESFLRNYGFDGKKGYQIDIGSFYHKENGIASIRDTMHPVRTWLGKIDPEMLAHFDHSLEEKLRERKCCQHSPL